MKTDPIALSKVIQYESAMRASGMRKVHVWVPTKEHAKEIKRIAAGMRKQHDDPAGGNA